MLLPAFHRHSIREVFFTSTPSPSEAVRTSGTHHAHQPAEVVVRDQSLKHVDAAARAFEDVIVRLAETRLDAIEDAVGAQLLELDAERRRWKRQWKQAEQEVARLEAELREARRERDSLRKGVRKVEVKADGLEVSVFLTS
jgi:chromosome segregation ATPase